MFRVLFSVLLLVLASLSTSAQYMMEAKQPDFYSFSKPAEQKLTSEAINLVAPEYRNHPEYAKNPYNAPCENCTELIDRRKIDERYFVENGTNGQIFYVQKSYGPLHVTDNTGNLLSLDARLTSTAPGIFTAENQHFPIRIDAVNHFASIKTPGHEFKFNTALQLLHKDTDGTLTMLGESNWTNYSAGDDGIKVFDVWPGIDMTIQAMQGQVKTNFIVNARLPFTGGSLIVKDKLDYAGNLNVNWSLATQTGENLFDGIASFYDNEGQEYYTIGRAFMRDASDADEAFFLSYQLTDEKEFSIFVPVDWLNEESRVYPVTIDPLVSASNTLPQASITGSGDGLGWTNGCPYPITVPVPANCTVTDILWTFNYNAIGTCLRNQGAVDFQLGACRSPDQSGFYWYCNNPTGGACNGNNISIFTDVDPCIPNPQCASYNLSLTMNFYRNNPSGGNTCNNLCIAAGSPWTVTIQGRTVEIPTITANQTICVGNSATITASGNYGVPPYTYSWSNGATGTSITVTPNTNTTYTATITDACNQTATASSTVTVTQNVNPGFTITPNPVCAGQPVTIAGLGAGPNSAYDWLFPSSTTPVFNNNKNPPAVTYNTAGTYNITLNYAQGACIFPLVQTIDVTPNGGAPSVTVAANPAGAICAGTSVTFTATPTNGGGAPTYQWQVNGVNAGSGGATFTTSTLTNGDAVTVIMTSSSTCVSPATGTSTAIIMVINPAVVPSVTIAANPAGAICAGTSVTFTATPTNGGGAPTYQWQVNGVNAGSGGATFTTSSLNNGDVVRVIMTSNANCASPTTATSNAITITVNPPVVPSVSITANPNTPVCPGTSITFTATPTNGGGAPTYQWQVNGVNAGSGGATFTTTTLTDGDVVRVIMTSNATCVSPTTATSNTITVSILPASVPSVSITANPAGPICAGTSITFTATPTNGGGAPTYQWQVNGTNAGTGATFTSSSLNNNDAVTVVMTSNATCASPPNATSNTITISVTTNLVPSVSIAANPTGIICAGTSVTFTATPTNGGNAPTYQWTVNGTNSGTGATFTSTTLSNNDVVAVVMTSNATCVSTPTATSNSINMLVLPIVAPTVSIAANPAGSICAGASVTFTATPTNGGVPTYQWQVNGTNSGTGATFTSTSLNNGDNVTVVMTSNAACVSPNTATSNTITMTVTPTVTPSVTVAAVPSGQICTGTSVTFTATPTNGGGAPTYQWQVNGTNAGTGVTFTSASLNDNDVVTVTMTSNATCASPATASSAPVTMDVSTTVVPSISIAAAPSNVICSGTNVTFTPTTSGGGNGPTYQWTVNGVNAGTNPTFSSSTLNDNDVIEVVMTSASTCATPQTATSNQVVMTVDQVVTPSVTIADSPSGPQCAGTSITITPTPVNEGTNPVYEWFINGVSSGNTALLTSSSFSDGDVVSVTLTSDAVCATPTTAASNSITIAIDQVINPSVTVAAVPAGTICFGEQVTFTATPSSAGANPTYQWTVNGTNAGTGDTFSSSSLNDGDVVVVTLTSASPCANPTSATSTPIIADVNAYVTPSVTIVASPSGPVCTGATVTFTASGTNGGSAAAYQWQINGVNVGTGTTFSSSSFNEGDVVFAILTSSEPCTNGNPATSNQIVMTLAQPIAVIASDDITVCSSSPISLDAQATGGDGIYSYTWNNGAGNGSTVSVNPAQTTTYSVTVSDQCGSTPASDDVTVTVNQPVASFGFTPELPDMNDSEVRFENQSQGGVDYFWDFGDGTTSTDINPVHNFGSPGDYTVTLTVTSAGGCVETTTYVITVDDVMAFWVPSAFTPNGDGLNDTFFMNGTMDKPYVMRVYNRLGSEIYFTDNSVPWNGAIFNVGDVVQNGVYVYEIDLDDSDFKGKTVVGRVTVIRDGR
ncbi:MAG: PKD domain-containing protein [Bacteroidia bacterium]